MTKGRIPLLSIWIVVGFCAAASDRCREEIDREFRPPTDSELTSLTGEVLPNRVKSVGWEAAEPPSTNLVVYVVRPAEYRPGHLESLGKALGVRGEIQRIPDSMVLDAPGFWIKEPNQTNRLRWKCVSFSTASGAIGFSAGEDNHRWDLKNHKPLAHGVPEEAEALERTLALLPVLGISTNDLEHLPDGRLRYGCNTEGTLYNDRNDGWKRKRCIRQINIDLWQKLRPGASILSIGGGGMLRAGYISEGQLATLEMTFRKFDAVGKALPRTSKEIMEMLGRGEARTFRSAVPESLKVTNCAVVYPQANASSKQEFSWPFYALSAVGVEDGETNAVAVYVPAKW